MLAAGKHCAETGTAFGEGAAAIASTAASLVTVESDPDRAAVAAERLRDFRNVEFLIGNWRQELPPRAPFGFLLFDSGELTESPEVIELLAPAGLLLKDDLSPDWHGPDPVREVLFGHPELLAVEILTTPTSSAIVAARVESASLQS